MRILFDQGVYDLRNKGNVALLQTAVERISAQWTYAEIRVMTSAPHLLRLYCPNAFPVSPDASYDWTQKSSLPNRLIRSLPRPVLRWVLELRDGVWHRYPMLGKLLTRQRQHAQESLEQPTSANAMPASTERKSHLELLEGVDLFVATGAQYMSDACRDDALKVLDRFEYAHRLGIPTAMVGQGLGPFEDADLLARVKQVLPLIDLIFIRDRVTAPPLLESLGVDATHVVFTGDDALEMVWRERTSSRGNAIGVSLRFAHYTEVGEQYLERIRAALLQAAHKHAASLVAIPISHSVHELDDRVIRQLLAGAKTMATHHGEFATPRDLIRMVSACRVVVTGAFHPAVFALAQGIPAIGLAKSKMYVEKFASLADQFGSACQVLALDDPAFQQKLGEAIERAWNVTETERAQMLVAAERQIELGHAAYQRLYALVESRKKDK